MRFALGMIVLATASAVFAVETGDDPVRPGKNAQREILNQFQAQLKQVAAKALPTVACIVVSRSDRYPKLPGAVDTPGKLGPFDRQEFLKSNPDKTKLADTLDLSLQERIPDHGCVNGVVIDPAGLILTTYLAIEGATKIYVYLRTAEGQNLGSYADVHAADARCDLAVLKLLNPPKDLKAITFADLRLARRGGQKATLEQGELIVLAAKTYSPGFLLDRPSTELGSVTKILLPHEKKDEVVSENFYRFGRLLEHDARLNASVTGGLLLDLDGNMIGLTVSRAVLHDRELNPGTAIPMDDNFRRIVEVLRKGEEVEYGFLGVGMKNQDTTITSLGQNSPADVAGLRLSDKFLRINGYDTNSFADVLLYTSSALAGTKVRVDFNRESRTMSTELIVGKYLNRLPFIATVRPEPVFGLRVDHLSVLTQSLNERAVPFTRVTDFPGVSIRECLPNSPAAQKLKDLNENVVNWRLTHVNDLAVYTPAEFYKAAKGQPSV
jgi:serine protease Do